MVKSVLPKSFLAQALITAAIIGMVSTAFKVIDNEEQLLQWSNKCFLECFDPESGQKLKKWDLTLTNDAFVRLRKTYVNGKQEYFSFNLHKFNDVSYLGTADAGMLQLKTVADDIIVQTYNDRKGNVDSMATVLTIPVRNMAPERMDSLRNVLIYFKLKP